MKLTVFSFTNQLEEHVDRGKAHIAEGNELTRLLAAQVDWKLTFAKCAKQLESKACRASHSVE